MNFRKKKEKKSFVWEEHWFKRIEWNFLIHFNKKSDQDNESYFKKWKEGIVLTIFTNAIKKMVFNTFFIIVTIFAIIAFLTSNLLGIYLLKPEKLDLKTICNTWIPFAILILYVMFFEIYSVHLLFFSAKQEGIINLETRSGYSKIQIFCERFAANKLIIWFFLTVLIIIQIIIGYTVDNLYLRLSIQHTLIGFLLTYFLDLFLFGFLLLFSNLGSSIPLSIIGTIMGLLFSCGAVLNLVSAQTLEKKINENTVLTLKEENAKYSFMLRMQNLINKYGKENSILGQSISAFYELKDLIIDPRFNSENGFYTQNQMTMEKYLPWHYLKTPYFNYDEYLIELMANGLILNVNEIPVYTELVSTANPTTLKINFSLMENNFLFQFLNELNELKLPINYKFQTQTAQNSLFRSYGATEGKTNHLFEGENGLFTFIQAMSIDSELQELGSLIKDAAIYLYQGKYSNHPNDDFDNLAPSMENSLPAHIWKYNLQQSVDYNQELLEHVWVSDGARTFIKIFFELLINFMDLSSPNYGKDKNDNLFSAQQYQHEAELFTYLNPFAAFARSFFELSNDENYLSTDYFNGWCFNTYELKDQKQNLKQLIEFENGNQFIRINLSQNYFNDPNWENSISLQELNATITDQIRYFIPLINLSFFVDFNKKIPIEKTGDSFILDMQVMEENQEHYRHYVNIKVAFKLVSNDLSEQIEQKNQLFKTFSENYSRYSPFFNKFITGKNYSTLKPLNSSFKPFVPLLVLPFLGLISICIGYWLFSKSVIK